MRYCTPRSYRPETCRCSIFLAALPIFIVFLARDAFVRTKSSRYCHDIRPSVSQSVRLSVWDGRAFWSYGAC